MRSSLATRGQRELSRCLRELGGGGGMSDGSHRRLTKGFRFSPRFLGERCACCARQAREAGGRGGSYCPTQDRQGRSNLGGAVSRRLQWQRQADQNFLAPPTSLAPRSVSRAGYSAHTAKTPPSYWRLSSTPPPPTLAGSSSPRLPHPGRGDPTFQTGPYPQPPSSQACLCSRSLPPTGSMSLLKGESSFHSLGN